VTSRAKVLPAIHPGDSIDLPTVQASIIGERRIGVPALLLPEGDAPDAPKPEDCGIIHEL